MNKTDIIVFKKDKQWIFKPYGNSKAANNSAFDNIQDAIDAAKELIGCRNGAIYVMNENGTVDQFASVNGAS